MAYLELLTIWISAAPLFVPQTSGAPAAPQADAQGGAPPTSGACLAEADVATLSPSTSAEATLPRLVMSGAPMEGNPFHLVVRTTGIDETRGVLMTSRTASRRPLLSGETLWPAQPFAVQPFEVRDGSSAPLLESSIVPPDLCGDRIYTQALLLDPGSGGRTLLTNALAITFGAPQRGPAFPNRAYIPDESSILNDVEHGDLDGDGDLDLVAAGARGLHVFLGDGDGEFPDYALVEGVDLGVSTIDPDVEIGDLDGDGVPDLVRTSSIIEAFLGNGDGTFSLVYSDQPLSGTRAECATGDLNGDGILDLVAGGDIVNSMRGNGDGTFFRVDGLFAGGSREYALAELTGDGALDLITASDSSAGSRVFPGDGSGTFEPAILLGAEARTVDVGDVDLDGDPDVVLGDFFDTYVVLNLGDGNFAPPVGLIGEDRVSDLEIGDMNGDGLPDLVLGKDGEEEIRIRRGLGGGLFRRSELYTVNNGIAALTLGDFDADGRKDVAGVGRRLFVVLGVEGGRLYDEVPPPAGIRVDDESAVGDLTGDLRVDAVVCSEQVGDPQAVLKVLRGDGDGTFAPVQTRPTGGTLVRQIEIADLTGDGLRDVLVLNGQSLAQPLGTARSNLGLLANNGNGLLDPVQTNLFLEDYSSQQMVLADFDVDGSLDVVAISVGRDRMTVFLGTAGGLQAPYTQFIQEAHSIDAGDLDLDGAPDLVWSAGTSIFPDKVRARLGRGDGTFAPGILVGVPSWPPRSIWTADLDGDGILDIAAASDISPIGFGERIGLYFGAGDGTFGPQVSLASEPGDLLDVRDIDADRIPDLLMIERADDAGADPPSIVHYHPGNGDGTFGPLEALEGGGQHVVDLDGDQLPDFFGPAGAYLNRVTKGL